MKDFLKNIFASFIGMALFVGIAIAISIIGIIGMAASMGSSTATLENNSVLVLNLSGTLSEQSSDPSPFEMINGQIDSNPGLTETIHAIKAAKASDKIKGIYIEANGIDADVAQLQEIRNAILDFKKSKKWVIAYGDEYTTGDYYVASVADKIYVNPQGMVDWHGIGGQIRFLKDLYGKFGIKSIAFKCGKYKSATETLTEDKMSDPARQQTERYLGQWWNTISDAVAKSRHIDKKLLNGYADRYITFEDPQVFVKTKFVDGLLYSDEIRNVIKTQLGIDKDDDISQATVTDMQDVDEDDSGDAIAVYYASGEIVDELPSQSYFKGGDYIVGNDMIEDINDLAKDDDVKAVVLRVNSPGGSSYASEQIWHAIEQLKKVKPVVVSMSGCAASGGYYISCGANYIYAEPTTITGSIGIFGIVQDATGLAQKLGVKFDEVKTNRNSTMGASFMGYLTKPLTTEQMALIQGQVNRGYTLFKSRVAQGRHLSMAAVEERAQGHVFTGVDAKALKLVDGLGGMDEAVRKAAQLAKLDEYHTVTSTDDENFLTKYFSEDSSNGNYLDEQLHLVLGEYYLPFMMLKRANCMGRIQARLPFDVILN